MDFDLLELINSLRGQSNLLESLMQTLSNNLFGLFLAFLVIPYLPPAPEITIKDNLEYFINSLKLDFENVLIISQEVFTGRLLH